MKKSNIMNLILVAVLVVASTAAYASKMTLTRKEVNELTSLPLASIDTAADLMVVFDASALDVRKVTVPPIVKSTATAAEVATIAGVTAGTVTASKAAVVNSSKNITGFNDVGLEGNLTFSTLAKGIILKNGSNGKVGTFVCTSGGTIAVANTSIAITDVITISLNTVGGTVSTNPTVSVITASSGFSAKCATSDTSTYNYAIISRAN